MEALALELGHLEPRIEFSPAVESPGLIAGHQRSFDALRLFTADTLSENENLIAEVSVYPWPIGLRERTDRPVLCSDCWENTPERPFG